MRRSKTRAFSARSSTYWVGGHEHVGRENRGERRHERQEPAAAGEGQRRARRIPAAGERGEREARHGPETEGERPEGRPEQQADDDGDPRRGMPGELAAQDVVDHRRLDEKHRVRRRERRRLQVGVAREGHADDHDAVLEQGEIDRRGGRVRVGLEDLPVGKLHGERIEPAGEIHRGHAVGVHRDQDRGPPRRAQFQIAARRDPDRVPRDAEQGRRRAQRGRRVEHAVAAHHEGEPARAAVGVADRVGVPDAGGGRAHRRQRLGEGAAGEQPVARGRIGRREPCERRDELDVPGLARRAREHLPVEARGGFGEEDVEQDQPRAGALQRVDEQGVVVPAPRPAPIGRDAVLADENDRDRRLDRLGPAQAKALVDGPQLEGAKELRAVDQHREGRDEHPEQGGAQQPPPHRSLEHQATSRQARSRSSSAPA